VQVVRKSIFIGSARESSAVAKGIAQALADGNYAPRRWWKEFPPGSTALTRLTELTQTVDGAVLIFSGVDKTWYRGDELPTPRDNVVLEYGIFIGSLGTRRTIVVAEEGTNLPSDISGLTFVTLQNDIETVAERVVQYFDDLFEERPSGQDYQLPRLIADPVIVNCQLGDVLPRDWHSRDLYVGLHGAKNWLNVASDDQYYPPSQWKRTVTRIVEMLSSVSVRTLVSLGPGDGRMDELLSLHMSHREPWLRYVPIDMNQYLLVMSIERIGQHVSVPVGILTDFEDRLAAVSNVVQTHGNPPMLFSMLGFTFGNLDGYELRFLEGLKSIMGKGDHLLLDYLLLSDTWDSTEYKEKAYTEYTSPFRRLLCQAVALRTGDSVEQVLGEFEERIAFLEGQSDVPEAYGTCIVDSKTNCLITHMRRYRTPTFHSWLGRILGFEVVDSDEIPGEQTYGGAGLVLLRK
jgi:hypothetical protein